MTTQEAEARLARIAAMVGDSEMQHSEEDKFHQDVLRAIADGVTHPTLLAQIALRTTELEFQRWYA